MNALNVEFNLNEKNHSVMDTKPEQDEIESPYEKYPKVFYVFDSEQAAELAKEESATLIRITELRNQLTDI